MEKPKKPLTKLPPENELPADDPTPPEGYAPAAAFDDTLARNRSCPVIDASRVPRAPAAYRPTNPAVRAKHLRKLSAELHPAAKDALREAIAHETTYLAELGPYSPDLKLAAPLLARLNETAALVATTRSLLAYAKELDQIATSDAVLFLEAENKQLINGMQHNGSLGDSYAALVSLFAARSASMREGQVRARRSKKAEAALKAEAEKLSKGVDPVK